MTNRIRRFSNSNWRRLSRGLAVALQVTAVLPLLVLVIASVGLPLPVELTQGTPEQSTRYEDRQGQLLREVRSASGQLSQWVPVNQVPRLFKEALVAVEDRRFYYHPGIDPLAVVRAVAQASWNGRIVSGASTLSMQLSRTVRPHRRNFWGKCTEMALALRIEASLSKSQILEQYLNRVDFGPNLRGVGAAAFGYFRKPLSALSVGEIALLVGLPQSPSAYALGRHPERALARRELVLRQLVEEAVLSQAESDQASREAVPPQLGNVAFGAPHFVSALLSGGLAQIQSELSAAELKQARRVRTTLEPELQREAETALTAALTGLRSHRVTSGAVLAVENATGDILAYVGSPNFYDEAQQGQVDGVRALRQPGSTLKPFVYAAAFEQLKFNAATVLPDLELRLETDAGTYAPRNFDDKFRGPVRLREALGNSLNVPAVHTAARLGAPALLSFLRRLGFSSLKNEPEFYGPALALGDGEVTLIELVHAYMTLARGGVAIPLRAVSQLETLEDGPHGSFARVKRLENEASDSVLSPAIAAVITDILKDQTARQASFGPHSPLKFEFEAAAKTGTSKGYRDNWVVGYTQRLTVGVWVGNFDGSPMRQVGGVTGAAPIFHAVLQAANAARVDPGLAISKWIEPLQLRERYDLKRVEICPISGEMRGEHCPHGIGEYLPANGELPTCQWHRKLALDRRNGLLAGPGCPEGVLQNEVFEIFPEQYEAWAKSVNRLRVPDRYSPHCPDSELAGGSSSLLVTYPKNGSRFVLDPERPRALQQLRVEATAPATMRELTLFVDDKRVAKGARPFEFNWLLVPGHHRLTVRSEAGEQSPAVEFDVRATEP